MREALLILRKDIDHRRWLLCAFLLLVLVRTIIDIRLPRHTELVMPQVVLGILFLAASIGLMYDSVWQERILGDRQYWLTRPVGWGNIVAAKALFLVLFIVLPVVLGSVAALAINGVSPFSAFDLAPALILNGAFVITLAAVTSTAVQFVLTAVVYVALSALSTVLIEHLFGLEAVLWGSAQRIRGDAYVLIELGAMAVVIWLQYRRRGTAISRAFVAAGMLVTIVGLPGWHTAFAILEKLEGPGPSGSVQVAFDSARPPQSSPGSWSNLAGGDVVGVRVPIAIAGIPRDTPLLEERYRATIDVPGGAHWDSGWRSIGGIISRMSARVDSSQITGDTEYWLEFNVDRSFFDAAHLQDIAVSLHGTVAFAILSPPQVVQLPVPCTAYPAGPGQLCTVAVQRGERVTIECLSKSQENLPDAAYWLIDGKIGQGVPMSRRVAGSSTWSAAFNAASLLNLQESRFDRPLVYQPFRMPDSVRLETRRTAGYFERTLAIEKIRLGPYEAGRSHGRRLLW